MWARVSRFDNNQPDDFDHGLATFAEMMLPLARQTSGWLGVMSLVTPDHLHSLAISLWRDQDALRAAESAVRTELVRPLTVAEAGRPTWTVEYRVALADAAVDWTSISATRVGEFGGGSSRHDLTNRVLFANDELSHLHRTD